MFGIFSSGVVGLLKSLSTTYYWFLFLEFIGTGFAAGTFQIGFIMGMEIIGPSKRPLGCVLLMCSSVAGRILVTFIAKAIQDFSLIIQCVYLPSLLVLSYLWFMPQSLKWLVVKGKKDEALVVIYKAAKTNKVIFSDGAMQELLAHSIIWWSQDNMDVLHHKAIELSIWKSKILLCRAIGCLTGWFLIALTDTSLLLNYSEIILAIDADSYWKHIFIAITEIPAYVIAYYIMNRISRRWSQWGSLFFAAIALFVPVFITFDKAIYLHLIHIFAKLCLSMATVVLYTLTSELFPTCMRNSVMCTCAMFARIGIILSPYTTSILVSLFNYIINACFKFIKIHFRP